MRLPITFHCLEIAWHLLRGVGVKGADLDLVLKK